MRSDVQALLALQADDTAIRGMELRLETMAPRLAELDRERDEAMSALGRARQAVADEEARHRELQSRQSDHRSLQERSSAQLEHVKKAKEASAAMLQMEQVGRFLAEDAGALDTSSLRLAELRGDVDALGEALGALETDQETERARLAEERKDIEAELREAKTKREQTSRSVSRGLLSRYDRIRRRGHANAVFALRGTACGNCDTAIPLQRRSIMAQTGAIELCEACGVLLYAAE